MKVIAICGSPRLKGNTSYLIDRALEALAERGVETEKIVLNEYKISPCQGHDDCALFPDCRQQDDAPWILDKLHRADGLILASPVYCSSISAQMKLLVDRNYFAFTHESGIKAVCAGLIVIAEAWGTEETVKALRGLLGPFSGRLITLTGLAGREGDILNHPDLIEKAREMGREMADILTGAAQAYSNRKPEK